MLSSSEIKQGIKGAFYLLWFDSRAAASFTTDWRGMWRSYTVLAVLLPLGLVMTAFANQPYFAKYSVNPASYLAVRLVGTLVLIPLVLWCQYMLARTQDAVARFPSYVAASNWFSLVSTFVFMLPWALTVLEILPNHTRTSIGISLFCLDIIYGWFIAWRLLKVNPFVAVGFVMMAIMLTTTYEDSVNIHFYGMARPFFADSDVPSVQ